ncbi:MAG: hypothetical protein U5R06_13350 [candidate division KSB1 bacterium]|nr:hypothetical protein [candidate division KSB1 bacterium]
MEILPSIYRIDGVHGCNVYLLVSNNELTLVDNRSGQNDRLIFFIADMETR